MYTSKAWFGVAALGLGAAWGCHHDEQRDRVMQTRSAETVPIDWRYDQNCQSSGGGDKCIFPPGAVHVEPTMEDGHVTCAGLGIGSTSTSVGDPSVIPHSPDTGYGAWQFELAAGNKLNLWSPEGWFWASSTPLDAVILRVTSSCCDQSSTMNSLVYRYAPAALASEWIHGYHDFTAEDGRQYHVSGLELCYTLRGADDAGTVGGNDAGTSSGGTSSGGTTSSSGGSADGGGGSSGKTW